MTGAEALSRWTGRMGLRKANVGRKCVCWALGRRCSTRHFETDRAPSCLPPGAAHLSVWGLGGPPGFPDLRALCSQPDAATVREAAGYMDTWCARWGVVRWDRPDLSWRRPGETALQVFVPEERLSRLSRRGRCPGCRSEARWADRSCCGVGDLLGWWETRAVMEALMGVGIDKEPHTW